MSRIITLGEHFYELPPEPKSQADVFFSQQKKADQFWRRQNDFPREFYDWHPNVIMYADHNHYNQDGDLVSLNKHTSNLVIDLREREMARRTHGVWFMNNGVLTYLTGSHYFFLQWCQMQSDNEETGLPYGSYREFQAHLSYFMEMIKNDPNSCGAYILKPKKTGVTQFIASDFVEESTRMRNKWFGMMSKSKEDAVNTNFMMFKNCYENMPKIMHPTIANENLSQMFFGNPLNSKNRAGRKGPGSLDFYSTRVVALPTVDDAFDGKKPYRSWCDELPKYIDPGPEAVFKKTLAAQKMGRIITGKMWISSYTPEIDNKSYEEAKKIFYESVMDTVNDKTGRTLSEIKAYFINFLDSAEGSFDKYGKTDRESNRVYLSDQTKQKKGDSAAIQALNRASPTTIDEAWRAGGAGGSTFDNIRLDDKLTTIKKEQKTGTLRYRECNLIWRGRPGDSQVGILPLTFEEKENNQFGLWRMYGMDYWRKEELNSVLLNNRRDVEGFLLPNEIVRYVASMDPTNYVEGNKVISGSKNSIWVFALPDPVLNAKYGKQVSYKPIAEYFYRQDKPSDTLDDIKKVLLLWGSPIVIEGNMPVWCTMLIESGLQNFLLVRDTKLKTIVPYSETEHASLITTQRGQDKATVNDLISITKEYLGKPTGNDYDNMDSVDSEILLQQLIEFDPLNTKKSDSAMGFMYGLLAMNCYDAIHRKLEEARKYYSKESFEGILSCLQ